MRKFITTALCTLTLLSVSSLAFAEGTSSHLDGASLGLVCAAAAIGMAIAAFGCGIGQGLGLRAACEGTARNPEAGNKITVTLILGMAFIESLAIYALVVNLILLFANPFVRL
ncbi:MAG: ATP synthase F0 subunit C [Deltaproteobacteria bacterium]|nr:ATP synthase F0 subunit C [Deltaproteobacteria bacterium]